MKIKWFDCISSIKEKKTEEEQRLEDEEQIRYLKEYKEKK